MKFSIKCLAIFFIFIWNISLGFETNVGAAGGKGYILFDDGSRIDGLWKVERGNLTKCKKCIMKYSNGSLFKSNIVLNKELNIYIPIGDFRYFGWIYDNDGNEYQVTIKGFSKKVSTGFGWIATGPTEVEYKGEINELNLFEDFSEVAAFLKKKESQKSITVNNSNSINDQQNNKDSIEIAKNECSELGLETGTEKFADCVLQLSR